ncbi:hypothetical protein [Helicobacter bizzozeronii]|uniref:hypothetical protein n=1 Tax=Helicobacter bizzozeronii TaxID=56877 RepID=UPI001315838E|nr:hypothetical protein [Helicobacter bizzozeronii]
MGVGFKCACIGLLRFVWDNPKSQANGYRIRVKIFLKGSLWQRIWISILRRWELWCIARIEIPGVAGVATEVGNAITKIVTLGNYEMKTYFEHSGIYVGNNKIQELIAKEVVKKDKDGKEIKWKKVGFIRLAPSPRHFITLLKDEQEGNLKKTGEIWVACDDKKRAIGSQEVMDNIEKFKVSLRGKEYDTIPATNLWSDPKDQINCHKFVMSCLTGKFKNKYESFKQLEDVIRSTFKRGLNWCHIPIE